MSKMAPGRRVVYVLYASLAVLTVFFIFYGTPDSGMSPEGAVKKADGRAEVWGTFGRAADEPNRTRDGVFGFVSPDDARRFDENRLLLLAESKQDTIGSENATLDSGSSPDAEPTARTCVILFWNLWFRWKDYRFGLGRDVFVKKCGTDRCRTTADRDEHSQATAVVFFAAKLDFHEHPVLPPRSYPEQVYVFLNTEPPAKYPTDLSRIATDFNITISYRRKSTIYWPYGKTLPKRVDYKPLSSDDMRTKNRTAAWMVSLCDDVNMRMTYYEELRKHVQIDVYGRCGELRCQESGRKTTECIEFIAKYYKFYLAFENSHCAEYVTEKAFRTLRYDLVPVVMGGANYSESLPPNSFIDVRDFESPKHLAQYLAYLDRNPDEYAKYFEWKHDYVVVDDIPNTDKVFCRLCDMLTSEASFVLGYDLVEWWEDGACVEDANQLRDIYHVK